MSTAEPSFTFLTNAFGDEVIYQVNRDAFDRIGSAAQFQRQFGGSLGRPDHLYIVIGTDSGLLVEWLLREPIADGTRYLFVEPEALCAQLRPRLALLDAQPRARLVDSQTWLESTQDFQFQEYAYLDQIRVVSSIGAVDAYSTDYRSIAWEIQNEVKRFVWQIEFQLGSQAFVMRQIENIADNRQPASCLRDGFIGRTAVLLGGGPSLDELIPWVQQQRDQLTVIAVSRICRRLLEAGLQPDIVVSIDPHPVSFDVSKEMLHFDARTLLIHSYHVTPLLLAQWHGPAVYFGERVPWKSRVNDTNLPNQGPTVTNTALAMAVHLGFTRVILGGVDLCYDRQGNTHASGSNEREAGPLLGNVGLQVETNGGWLADTRHSFASAVEIMGNQADTARQRGCTIVNPAAGAARIPHVEYLPLNQIVLDEQPQPAHEQIAELLPIADTRAWQAHYRRMRKELLRTRGRLHAIIGLADDALACNDGLFGRNGKTADFKYKLRMDKIERRLDREYKDLAPLVKTFGSRRFLRLVRPDQERDWSDDQIEEWGRAYYEAYKDSAQILIDRIDESRSRLDARSAEFDKPTDLPLLLAQWDRDQTPGRALVWQRHHPQAVAALPDAQREELNMRIQRFDQILAQRETVQAQWCKENYTLAPVRSKLAVLFQHHERDELIRTIGELATQSGGEAASLHALGKGYLAELDGDEDGALQAYTYLVDDAVAHMQDNDGQLPRSPALEDALRRMAGITVGRQQLEDALPIMDTLSNLSPVYQPQYADLLRLAGDLQGAAELYSSYLRLAPNDLGAVLKLGKLFQEAGVTESAQWAYNYVLEKDPGNRAASTLLAGLSPPLH